jgi:3-phenylpropionate/trans-cinnamate dioxygenase alpha subunit
MSRIDRSDFARVTSAGTLKKIVAKTNQQERDMLDQSGNLNRRARTANARMFSDPAIYEDEKEKIFGKCWLYLGHESQIPEARNFITTYMGEDPIILWRGADGKVRAFLNSCTHRGMKICREDEGRATRFSCPYHGWTYDSSGKLIGRPSKERYDEHSDPDEWGLIEVAKVDQYAGLIFATFDDNAESLEDYLGEIKWYLDTQFRRTSAGRLVFPGVQKWVLNINWKIAAEQLAGDNYHATIAHASAVRLGLLGDASKFAQAAPFEQDFQVRTSQGHGWINLNPSRSPYAPAQEFDAYEAGVRERANDILSPKQAELAITGAVGAIFPNFAFISFLGGLGLRVMHPRGPEKTEIWLWSAADADAPEWRQKLSKDINTRNFTAAGLFDMDDAEMWLGCQQTLRGHQRKKHPLNYQLGGATARREVERPGLIDSAPSEIGVFGFHERWDELMSRDQK